MIVATVKHALMITSFVFVMMLLVEYINVQTQGGWNRIFKGSRWRQYFLAAFLGALPGCLGAFTVTTLYSHRILSFGALVAAMITTSGDEAFIMFGLMPGTALLLTGILFVSSLILAVIIDSWPAVQRWLENDQFHQLPIHDQSDCKCFNRKIILLQLKDLSLQRLFLMVILLLLLIGLSTGILGPSTWDWKRITFVSGMLITLFIVSTVPEHFLQEHLWVHLVKHHVPRVFLWTFGILLILNILEGYLDLDHIIADNYYLVLLLAVVIGLIPQSGPHFVFIALFLEGRLPFSILLANSASQDGHGTLPLLAGSKLTFFHLKLINLIWGFILGMVFHLFEPAFRTYL